MFHTTTSATSASSSSVPANNNNSNNNKPVPQVQLTQSESSDIPMILQHRLFQGWLAAPSTATATTTTTTASAEGDNDDRSTASSSAASSSFRIKVTSRAGRSTSSTVEAAVAEKTVEVEEVVLSDDDEGVPSNPLGLEPQQRVRRARHPDGSTSLVRVHGGWMTPPPPSVAAEAEAEAVAKKRPRSRGNGGEDGEAVGNEDGENEEEEDAATQAAAAEELKRKVLAKSAARTVAASGAGAGGAAGAASVASALSLPARYKAEVMEAAVSFAQTTSSHKRGSSSSGNSRSGAAPLDGALQQQQQQHSATFLAELKESYQARPSLSFLPLEDGGVRLTSISCAATPRTLHPLCARNAMCAYCLAYVDPGQAVFSEAAVTSQLSKHQNGKAKGKRGSNGKVKQSTVPLELTPAEVDRHHLVSLEFGAVSYSIHKQCAHNLGQDKLLSDRFSEGSGGAKGEERVDQKQKQRKDEGAIADAIQLGEVYEYEHEQAEDADCDLCGRRGGVLRYFQIGAVHSAIAAPAQEGWLAHVPCIHYLQHSRLLVPLRKHQNGANGNRNKNGSSGGVKIAGESFNANMFSYEISRLQLSEPAAVEPPPTAAAAAAAAARRKKTNTSSRSSNGSAEEEEEEVSQVMKDVTCAIEAAHSSASSEADTNSLAGDVVATVAAVEEDVAEGGINCSHSLASSSSASSFSSSPRAIYSSARASRSAEQQQQEEEEAEEELERRRAAKEAHQAKQMLERNQLFTYSVAEFDTVPTGNDEHGGDETNVMGSNTTEGAPRSRFDQLLGHWRCVLCGLQCGVALRCVAACCAVRAHPLCVAVAGSGEWQLCSLSATATTTASPAAATAGAPASSGGTVLAENGALQSSKTSGSIATLGILCSLHSAAFVGYQC